MQQAKKFFENFLSDKDISDLRLYKFLAALIASLTSQNGGGAYTALIGIVTSASDALRLELGNVDVDETMLKGFTLTNDEVVKELGDTMKAKEGVIADALGGFGKPPYMRFYPHGFGEYTKATKTEMPTLVNRVWEAAKDYKPDLSTKLFDLLQSYKDKWFTSRGEQEQQKGSLEGNRKDKTTARTAGELAGIIAVHTIGAKFPGDVDTCLSFFDFSVLFHHSHKKPELYANTVGAGETGVAFNKTYTETNEFELINHSENADYAAWFAATADAPYNGKGKTIKATKTHSATYNELDGGEGKPFLIIKNLSDVNEVKFVVEVR